MLAGLKKGWQEASAIMTAMGDYGHTILPTKEGRQFYKRLGEKGITATETPLQLAGALGARLLTDLGHDETRKLYWRFNHPMAISEKVAEGVMGENIKRYTQPQKAAIGLAAVGVPVSASLGTYDITNLAELGRPKGFSQTYAETGSEDRRETGQVGPELVDRFVLGRQGRPLKFETAKEDIPDLTKQRYSNYMNFLYNEKGPLGVGVIKGTMENLQGEPEARIVGFPVGLQAAGALAGGAGTARAVMGQASKKQPRVKTRTVVGASAAGALAGALAGKFANRMIAAAGQSDLPTTQEYGVTGQSLISKVTEITEKELNRIQPERTFNGSPEGELIMASIRGYGPYEDLEKVGLNTPEKLEQRRQELMQLDQYSS